MIDEWIENQRGQMIEKITRWAEINSGSYHTRGLNRLGRELTSEFRPLCDRQETIELEPEATINDQGEKESRPLGPLLWMKKRPDRAKRILLGIHMDTVFGEDHPFQAVRQTEEHVLTGPGVTDAKGGIAVMKTALEAFEKTGEADQVGWDVFINPDEEIGSPGSAPILMNRAPNYDIALLFEPSRSDGSLVGARKGSGNYTAVFRGSAAHAGQNTERAPSATHAMIEFSEQLRSLHAPDQGITVNIGMIRGGGPVNVIADFALVRFNIRVRTHDQMTRMEQSLDQLRETILNHRDIELELHGEFSGPPRPLENKQRRLLESARECGREFGLELSWSSSGGITDGNRLYKAGLPNLDTLGPVGDQIHSRGEKLYLNSLVPRTKLAFRMLRRWAEGLIQFT